jgi:hypothetical protein
MRRAVAIIAMPADPVVDEAERRRRLRKARKARYAERRRAGLRCKSIELSEELLAELERDGIDTDDPQALGEAWEADREAP